MKIKDSNISPSPQFQAHTLRHSMLGTGRLRSRSEAVEEAFGVSRERETSGGFGSMRGPKALNTIMYLPRLGLSGRGFGEEVDKTLSLSSRHGAQTTQTTEKMEE